MSRNDPVKSQRMIEERVGARWPSTARRMMRWVLRLPPGSRVMEDWNDAWQEWDAEIDEIVEEGRDQVLFVARVSGVGAASGIKVDEWSAARYTFREGRILRIEGALHSDKDRALDALGAIK